MNIMKSIIATLFCVLAAIQLPAATNAAPVKLAIIAESPDAGTSDGLLTAEFTKNDRVQLLERVEIDKVYREQGLATANRDYVKLGRILGADGLMLLNVTRSSQATNLTMRLTAVKPGVVLIEGDVSWPLKDGVQWSQALAAGLDKYLPKLALLPKDAIPLSLVNLRSAIQSDDAKETEQQLKVLTIQRLSQEPEFFVLERQRMQLLSEEKELKSDESAFWNGSYLLEGVVDQNGYSKDVLTINARLTPPKGGEPLSFEVRGSRTNLAAAVNQLGVKVAELLRVNSPMKEWNAADEAAQYFGEAQWALKWGVLKEAQTAADSAWALGKHDMDCAVVRVKAYEAPLQVRGYQKGVFTNPSNTNDVIQTAVEHAAPDTPWGLRLRVQDYNGVKSVEYVYACKAPDPAEIDLATRALELYYQFSLNSPEDLLKVASEQSMWKNSDWYNLGIEDLEVASTVLQHFNFVPEAQKSAGDKLAELRRSARVVADWISRSPVVQDSYFVGDRVVVYDELANTIDENPNIFRCKVRWGCFWQEKPEEAVALYRELIASPVFCYIHSDFWLREPQMPRLIAWNQADQQRIPLLWSNFSGELKGATNLLLQLEAKALALADADNDNELGSSFTNFFETIFGNRDVLIGNPVDIMYLGWHVDRLVSARTGTEIFTDLHDSLNRLYYSQYSQKLDQMDQEYRAKTAAGTTASTFKRQKQYLAGLTPFDFSNFNDVFSSTDYTKSQAAELKPLIVAYKSNLLARTSLRDPSTNARASLERFKVQSNIQNVEFFLEKHVDDILNPPAPAALPPVQAQNPPTPPPAVISPPALATQKQAKGSVAASTIELVTNVLTVEKFMEIPLDNLIRLSGLGKIDSSRIIISAHQWLEGKLLMDFKYQLVNNWSGAADGSAIAILDPATEQWDIALCSKGDISLPLRGRFHSSTFLHGELFNCDGGRIRRYDHQSHDWQVLPVSDGNNYELFAIAGRLYAANGNAILEIVDEGKSTRILASTRRNPPASILDGENLGTPTLFEGPNHSLRVCTAGKIFTWAGSDWHEDSAVPPDSSLPEVFMDGLLFRRCGFVAAAYQNDAMFRKADGTYGNLQSQDAFFCLANEDNAARLCLKGKMDRSPGFSTPDKRLAPTSKVFWEMPNNMLPNLAAAVRQSDLYLLEDNFAAHASVNDRQEIVQEDVDAKDKYNAALLCFSHDLPLPQKIYLRFNSPEEKTPAWMFPTANLLIFGGNSKGIWMLPLDQIDSAITAQKETQRDQKAHALEAIKQARQHLIAKYDLNRNGVIDGDEREAALEDEKFVEAQLEAIDTNHNGWLDAPELAWFDANQNKILEPKEQTGIGLAVNLLAKRLLATRDPDGNGFLNMQKYDEMIESSLGIDINRMTPDMTLRFSFADANHDNQIDVDELERLMQRRLALGLRSSGIRRPPGFPPMGMAGMNRESSVDARQNFKAQVETCWQNAGGTNRPAAGGNP